MDDRELAKIIRKRNLAYVKHLNETSPHTQSHDKLEGGFLSAVAAAAKIAIKMALRATKATAKAAAKAAKAAARAGKKAAQTAARLAKKATKGKTLDKLDKAMTIADVGQAAYSIAQILMKKSKEGTALTDEEFKKLTMSQQIEVDFQRWARGLERADYELFKQRGGDKTAAMQLARLMDAGADPDDWVGNEVNAVIETAAAELEEWEDYKPEEDEECEDELDKDDRSDAEKIGLTALSLIDQGIGEAISDGLLEKRNEARRRDCINRKTIEKKDNMSRIKRSMGLDPNEPFDFDDLDGNLAVQAHVLAGLAAKNPNVNLALKLDSKRELAGLPRISKTGIELKSPDTLHNDEIEKLTMWFILNETSDIAGYPDQNYIQSELRKDPFFVERALARMPYFDDFASTNKEVQALAFSLTSPFKALSSPLQEEINRAIDNPPPEWNADTTYETGQVVFYKRKFYRCGRGKGYGEEYTLTKAQDLQLGDFTIKADEVSKEPQTYTYTGKEAEPGKSYTGSDWLDKLKNAVWQEVKYEKPVANSDGIKKGQSIIDRFEDDPLVKAAALKVSKADERIRAQSARQPWKPNTDYKMGNLVTYNGYVYSCIEDHKSGDKIDLKKWDQLELYDEEELAELKNIGSATPYDNSIVYEVGMFVKYTDTTNPQTNERIFKKIKESTAGILPTDTEYWDEILLKDGDLIDLRSNPNRRWKPDTDYKKGDRVSFTDLHNYVAINNVGKNIPPNDPTYAKQYWKKLISYDITPELATQILKEQRLAVFATVVSVAAGYDPEEAYQLRDIVYAFDGKYYELIKEKKDKDGDVVPPPIPPHETYWKVVSKGITVWDPKETYDINDFVQYGDKKPDDKGDDEGDDEDEEDEEGDTGPLKQNYLCIKKTTAGTLPTDENYWQPLDEQFTLLDEEAIAVNKQNYDNAFMNRATEFQDDVTASYEVDEIVKVFVDGYPQFYKCIKAIPFGRASGDALRKAKPYDNVMVYHNGDVMSYYGIIYEMIGQNGGYGFNPSAYPSIWKAVGYEKDPGPPNEEFWKDYSSIDMEEEKYDKLRKGAKVGTQDTTGIKIGDLVSDPKTGSFYKLIIDSTKRIPTNRTVFDMKELPYFNNTRKPDISGTDQTSHLLWEQQDIPTELEAQVATLVARSKWRNTRLYKQNDLVTDKYNLKYLVLKDTPYAPMEPHLNPDYFALLDEDDWEDAIHQAEQDLENTADVARANESIRFDEVERYKPRAWGEIVFYDKKLYKFFAYSQSNTKNTPTQPKQELPGKLNNSGHPLLEWYPCDSDGNLLIVEQKDYIINLKEPYIYNYTKENKGPIIFTDNIYLIYNARNKDIFGLGTGKFGEAEGLRSLDWEPLGDKDHRPDPQDTFTTEVFKDGNPKFKHDNTGAIIGTNIDTSLLPPGEAAAITDIVDEQDCPAAPGDGDNDTPTHHETVQAGKDLKEAQIVATVKGEEDPALIQGQTTTPSVGTASGYNIEELDGSQYHQKKKRVYKKKNKSKM